MPPDHTHRFWQTINEFYFPRVFVRRRLFLHEFLKFRFQVAGSRVFDDFFELWCEDDERFDNLKQE